MFNISANSCHGFVQFFLFSASQLVSWVKDRWNLEGRESSCWVLLKIFLGEDGFDLLVEIKVSNLVWVDWASEEVLELFEFLDGKL